MTINLESRVGPFVGVTRNETVKHGERTFRVVLYGAYDAMGLIGSEFNGIGVLDEDQRQVLLDNECRITSGWFGPAASQLARFEEILAMPWPEFQRWVNEHPRRRYEI